MNAGYEEGLFLVFGFLIIRARISTLLAPDSREPPQGRSTHVTTTPPHTHTLNRHRHLQHHINTTFIRSSPAHSLLSWRVVGAARFGGRPSVLGRAIEAPLFPVAVLAVGALAAATVNHADTAGVNVVAGSVLLQMVARWLRERGRETTWRHATEEDSDWPGLDWTGKTVSFGLCRSSHTLSLFFSSLRVRSHVLSTLDLSRLYAQTPAFP